MGEVRIPSPKEPVVGEDRQISRGWWRFLHDMWQRTGGEGDVTLQAAGDDLTAIEALSGFGFAVRTATNTWTQRDIDAGGSGFSAISVSDGDGVSGNPTLSITGVTGNNAATDNITSGTTQTQVGATALTGSFNRVATHGNTDDGVKLPAAVAGLRVTIVNDTATADLQVWPATDDAIESASANDVGVDKVGIDFVITYQAVDATTWYITDSYDRSP